MKKVWAEMVLGILGLVGGGFCFGELAYIWVNFGIAPNRIFFASLLALLFLGAIAVGVYTIVDTIKEAERNVLDELAREMKEKNIEFTKRG